MIAIVRGESNLMPPNVRASRLGLAVVLALLAQAGCAAGGRFGGSTTPVFGARGAAWTIRCIELTGPNRKTQAAQLAQTLKQTPGVRAADVFTFSDAEKTGLYYGHYRRATDARTGKRDTPAQMRRDLDLIKQLGDDRGRRYFLAALPSRLPTPDVGNLEWDLSNVAGLYSLQVAAFEPTDDFAEFKQAAADYCRFLREQGFQAYYHHAEASSVVTVGVFGDNAFSMRQQGNRYLHLYSDEVAALQQNDLLKYNHLNGGVVFVIGEDGSRNPVPSFLVEIPKRETSGGS